MTLTILCMLVQPIVVLASAQGCCADEADAVASAKQAAASCCEHVPQTSKASSHHTKFPMTLPDEQDSDDPQDGCSCPAGLCCVRANMTAPAIRGDLKNYKLPTARYAMVFVQRPAMVQPLDITVPPPQNLPVA